MSTTQHSATKRALVLTEEQTMIKESARDFLKEMAPVAVLRTLRDSRDPQGYDINLWNQMAEMGWPAMTISEEYGGLDLGYLELGQVLEETGRTLAASPLVSTVLLSATAIQLGGSTAQQSNWLPRIASGETVMAFALDENKHHGPEKTALNAEVQGEQVILNGSKTFVLDGHVADHIIVVARTSGQIGSMEGISLFLVDANTKGIAISRTIMADSRNASKITFEQVNIPISQLLGEMDKGGQWLERTLDIARIGLSAELLGVIREAFDRTVNYLKERQQFGVPIGSFQALQHRAAEMFCEIELCKSVVLKGLHAIDAGDDTLPALASLCKAKLCEVAQLVSNEAVQMYGGIGMTDDEEIGFFLKRARVAQHTLGSYAYHADRFARLSGY